MSGAVLMGLLDWLQGNRKPSVRLPDRIWLTEGAMVECFLDEVLERREAIPVILLAHFPDEVRQIAGELAASRIPFEEWLPPRSPLDALRDIRGAGSRVLLSGVPGLPEWRSEDAIRTQEELSVMILAFNHHPLAREDERIDRFARCLPCRTWVQFFTSLDHPLMRVFAGEQVKRILIQLGMHDQGAIEHPMLNRQILRAQKKFQRSSILNPGARSCEQWLAPTLADTDP